VFRETGDRHQAAQALGDLVESGPIPIGAILAEPRDAGQDDARIDLAQRGVINAQPVFHIRPVVFDHHISRGHQLAKQGNALRRLEIQRDRALVAMQILEVRALARTPQIFFASGLDLDDIGAKVSEMSGADRARPHAGQVEHTQVGQGVGCLNSSHGLLGIRSSLSARD